ncbi:hypothetical protein THAOC_34010, partial [Thalassiosira oceanica]
METPGGSRSLLWEDSDYSFIQQDISIKGRAILWSMDRYRTSVAGAYSKPNFHGRLPWKKRRMASPGDTAPPFGPCFARAPSETMAGTVEARRELMATAALVEAAADGSTVESTA